MFKALAMLLSYITNTVAVQASKISTRVCHSRKGRDNKKCHRITTIESLPAELITEIFHLLTFETDQSRILAPVVLSHVSRRWRAIAFRTSDLWTSIVLTFPCPREDIERMRMGLILSHKRPLDIHIDLRDEDWDWQGDDSHEMQADDMLSIFNLISDDAHRWRSLEILADNWQPIHAFLALSTKLSSLPMLNRLSLSRCNGYYGIYGSSFAPTELKAPIALFGENAVMPKLRSITLAGVHVDWAACSGLRDLAELEFKYLASDVVPTMQDFLRIIRASPQLETLTLAGCVPHYSDAAAPSISPEMRLAIPTLKRFNFGWSDVQEAVELLSMFRLSGLDELSLEDVLSSLYHATGQDSSPIIDLLLELDCPTPDSSSPRAHYPLSRLRKLTLSAVSVDAATFRRLLEKTVNLEEIVLRGVDVRLVQVIGAAESSLCPKLKKLGVRFPERLADVVNDALDGIKLLREGLQIEGMELSAGNLSDIDSDDSDMEAYL